ncbi:MAG: polyphosphate kinase [Sphingomonas fennica]
MIDLTDFEAGDPPSRPYAATLAALQARLEHIHVAHIVHGRRAVVMLEGWDAAGKGGIIERLTEGWDARHTIVWPIGAPTPAEKAEDFLTRFERRLPLPGTIAIFDRSWYGRVLVERVEGFASAEEWGAAYDAINAFEAGLAAGGTTLVKLFVHITQKVQDKRIAKRIRNPWKRWKTGPEDFRNRARRADYLAAMADMFARTDTAAAPWVVIDGNDKKAARLAALEAVADRLQAAVPMDPPPLSNELRRLAREELGLKVKR